MPAADRGYSAASFALEIGGRFAGYLSSVEGGEVYGKVVESVANDKVDKRISGFAYDDIVITCGVPEEPLASWLAKFLEGQTLAKDGAVVFLDLNHRAQTRLEWRAGEIASVTLPALNVAGDQSGRLSVTIRPESTSSKQGDGAAGKIGAKSRAWSESNFAVSIPGVSCTKVTSVEALTISRAPVLAEGVPVTERERVRRPPLHVGDLALAVADSGAADFVSWMDSSVVHGNRAAGEKTATIRYLDQSRKHDLMTLQLTAVGIYRLDSDRAVSGVSVTARKRAAMYSEGVTLTVPGPDPAAPAAAPAPDPAPAAAPGPAKDANADLSGVLGERLESRDVARRLRDSLTPRAALSEADHQRRLGYDVGVAWAERRASLVELEELAVVGDERDWSAIALPAGHSLVESLEASGIIKLPSDGRLELIRDSLAEGILAGILSVMSEVAEDITSNLR